MVFWNLAFLDEHRFRDTPGFSREGKIAALYLATALGHCGECHTPRNIAFAMDNGRQFAGTMVEGWHAYNITLDEGSGVGGWSNQQLADIISRPAIPTGEVQQQGRWVKRWLTASNI